MKAAGEQVFWQEMVRALLNLSAAAKSIAGVIRKHKLEDKGKDNEQE